MPLVKEQCSLFDYQGGGTNHQGGGPKSEQQQLASGIHTTLSNKVRQSKVCDDFHTAGKQDWFSHGQGIAVSETNLTRKRLSDAEDSKAGPKHTHNQAQRIGSWPAVLKQVCVGVAAGFGASTSYFNFRN